MPPRNISLLPPFLLLCALCRLELCALSRLWIQYFQQITLLLQCRASQKAFCFWILFVGFIPKQEFFANILQSFCSFQFSVNGLVSYIYASLASRIYTIFLGQFEIFLGFTFILTYFRGGIYATSRCCLQKVIYRVGGFEGDIFERWLCYGTFFSIFFASFFKRLLHKGTAGHDYG